MIFDNKTHKYYKTLEKLSKKATESVMIDPALYANYDVKRGLRDLDGKGVLTGLTYISDIVSFVEGKNGERISCLGELYYRGYNIKDLVKGFMNSKVPGFEESAYLLLFGELPNAKQLEEFRNILASLRTLPRSFVRDMIMKAPTQNVMNSLARSVLALYHYDNNADDISISNILHQSLQLIAQFPMIAVYSYKVAQYYYHDKSLIIHQPNPELSHTENVLSMLRGEGQYSQLEVKLLDLLLVLHQEHGGGNNSSFATHLISSTGTDTYSCVASSLSSLKGPKHGGANLKVINMMDDIKRNVNYKKKSELENYLVKILDKKAFDQTGLIYGMGHAVYSISDPRAEIIDKYAKKLAIEKGREEEYELYDNVAKIGANLIKQKRKIYKGVSPNVDFYSGFVYKILEIPEELFTPLFAIARIVGWSAHRIEEVANCGKIIRPGYVNIQEHLKYIPFNKRK